MEAKIKQEGDVNIVRLSGKIDLDTVNKFRTACLERLVNRKVVISMGELFFVGSNGIVIFLETLKELGKRNTRSIRVCGARPEFLKIFAAHNLDRVDAYDDERKAMVSFSYAQPQIDFLPKRKETIFQSNIQTSFKEKEKEQEQSQTASAESQRDEEREGIYPDFSEQVRNGKFNYK